MQREQWTAASILSALSEQCPKLYELGVRKLGLFGSYIRGNQTAGSDIDFVVALADDSFDSYMNVKLFLEDFLGYKVDLVPEDRIKPRLRPHIMREVMYVEGF